MTVKERTQVGIVGAGQAGLLLSHLLALGGVESRVVELRSRAHCEARQRAGMLEPATARLLRDAGLGRRLDAEGLQHDGIYIRFEGEGHHVKGRPGARGRLAPPRPGRLGRLQRFRPGFRQPRPRLRVERRVVPDVCVRACRPAPRSGTAREGQSAPGRERNQRRTGPGAFQPVGRWRVIVPVVPAGRAPWTRTRLSRVTIRAVQGSPARAATGPRRPLSAWRRMAGAR
jgi:FAD binding domain